MEILVGVSDELVRDDCEEECSILLEICNCGILSCLFYIIF